jgi:hypothetical protein
MPPAHRLPCTTPHPVRLSAFASRGRSARTSSSYGSATFLPAVPQEVVSLYGSATFLPAVPQEVVSLR